MLYVKYSIQRYYDEGKMGNATWKSKAALQVLKATLNSGAT